MRKNIYSLIACCLGGLLSTHALAQQDPQFSQYMFNSMYLNAGYAGMDDGGRAQLMYRNQWTGYSGFNGSGGNPETFVGTFNAPLYRLNSGVGVHVMSDQLGPSNNLEVQVSFAHHLPIGEGKLGIGVRGGVYSMGFDRGLLRPVQTDDPVLNTGGETTVRPDLGAGLWYKHENYFAGASVNHLLRPAFDFGGGSDSANTVLDHHMYITGGYHFDLTYSLRLTPSFIVKSVAYERYSVEVSALATYNERFWGGLSYRQEDAAIAMLGFSMLENNALRFGYAFDLTVNNREAKQLTSHEIMLAYTFPIAVVGSKPQIRTPRFRH